MKTIAPLLFLPLTLALSACEPDKAGKAPSPATPTAAAEKVKFKGADGKAKFSIKTKSDGFKLVDGSEKELARYKVSGDKIKIKDSADSVIAVIKGDATKVKVKDESQKVEYYVLKARDDGGFKLEDGQGKLLYKVKARDYGFEVFDSDETTSLSKIKTKGDKALIQDAKGQTSLSTKDGFPARAMIALAFEKVPLEQRVGLALFLKKRS